MNRAMARDTSELHSVAKALAVCVLTSLATCSVACSGRGTDPTSEPRAFSQGLASDDDGLQPIVPPVTDAGAPSLDCGRFVPQLLLQMTLAEKIGQMTLIDHTAVSNLSDLGRLGIGGVLSGGNSDPAAGNSPAAWQAQVIAYKQAAQQSRLGIPLIYGIDAVHGHSNVAGAVIFPHNIGLGATRDANLVLQLAQATAAEVAATGIDWTFSPVLAAARDERWGRTYEAFSEAPDLAGTLGAAAVVGFQGSSLSGSSILATAKHFAGDGGTQGGVDRGNTVGSDDVLFPLHLAQFKNAIAAGVGSVMVSYSSWNGQRMHGNAHMLTDILKGKLGFTGLVVSDWGGLDDLAGSVDDQVATAIDAGIDMVMVPFDYASFEAALTRDVPARVPMSRIDDAVSRILSTKCQAGLFSKTLPAPAALKIVGSPAHRTLGRQAVRESLVLLKNDRQTLPVSRQARRIHVSGPAAVSLAQQCGGWTVGWQGLPGFGDIPGTTVLQAIQHAFPGTVTYSSDGTGAAGADVAIAVVGEQPYAEFVGDDPRLELSAADVGVLDTLHASGVPVVTVLFSGRPLIIQPQLAKADAWLAAWLPGTEGDGIADVLFGDFAPRGVLSFSWPRSIADLPLNVGDPGIDPLFPYGYGLRYPLKRPPVAPL